MLICKYISFINSIIIVFVTFSLSVQEALALLDDLWHDEEFMTADIIITPPTNGNLTDEHSGPEEALSVDIFYGSQLRTLATVKMNYKGAAT